VNLPKLDSLEEDFREEAELPRRALNIFTISQSSQHSHDSSKKSYLYSCLFYVFCNKINYFSIFNEFTSVKNYPKILVLDRAQDATTK